ncbi:hypothetical protein [Arthrobacter rhizosphaerae]|uniref:hypothetical protein n=1 Tax=Arthrobacter rhizosphaerae TaxID=2855490 RepID=UPI001FF44AE0|nr:hypothetical protein [Arthrobacter rhizosphaerae]
MRVFRRVILPVAWLAVFAVIAVTLVKIAFVDGLKPDDAVAGPSAQVAIPVVQAARATVTNSVEIKATVQSDAPVGVRSAAAGVVSHIFLEAGAKVALGERLYQVRTELPPEPIEETEQSTTTAGEPGASPPRQVARVPLYTYTDVLAPVSGTLETMTVLLKQQVGVGEVTGTVNPGTFTVSGSVNAAQQYRLLAKPGSALVSVVGGPAPFTCPTVILKNNASSDTPATGGGGGLASAGGGSVGRSVPYAQAGGPAGGGSAPEQDNTPTGTLSCAIPSGVEVFAGLGATMTVTAGESANVVTVPLTAVQGSVKDGIVWLAPAGSVPAAGGDGGPAGPGAAGSAAGPPAEAPANAAPPEQRKVQLGLNDGTVVEIVSGLAEGESVLEFVPGAPAQEQPGAQFGPGPMGG